MSKKPIWVFKFPDVEMRTALQAEWSRNDLYWERLMESALRDWESNSYRRAVFKFKLALQLTRLCFSQNDIRRATCHANIAIVSSIRGNETLTKTHQSKAQKIWKNASSMTNELKILPRSRSSLFHMRMEVKHKATFTKNQNLRMEKFIQETEETLNNLNSDSPPKHRHYSRWRGEKPALHDDIRKILGACLLIIDR